MQAKINNTTYYIDEFADGYAWSTKDEESLFTFPTEIKALENAMQHERMVSNRLEEELAQRLEDEAYGTYQQQVNDLYKVTRL